MNKTKPIYPRTIPTDKRRAYQPGVLEPTRIWHKQHCVLHAMSMRTVRRMSLMEATCSSILRSEISESEHLKEAEDLRY